MSESGEDIEDYLEELEDPDGSDSGDNQRAPHLEDLEGELPSDYEPVITHFHDERLQLSHWYPRLESLDVPTPETHIFELEGETDRHLGDRDQPDVDEAKIFMSEDPAAKVVLAGKPPVDEMVECIREMGDGAVFLRSMYKSGNNFGERSSRIEEGSEEAVLRAFTSIIDDHFMMRLPTGGALAIREWLDLDHCSYSSGLHLDETLHPEVRFFIDGGGIHYWFPRIEPEDFVRATGSPDLYFQAIEAIERDIEQLREWAQLAAGEFDEASWSLDFVRDRHGDWYATDMALNGLYYSPRKEAWINISAHDPFSPYNLEQHFGENLPDDPDIDQLQGLGR